MASKREVSIIIRAVDRASRVLRSVSNSATRDLKRVGDAAQSAARSIGLIGAALTLSLGLAINTTADFQQSMANTQSVIGATTEELMTLTEAAREMGKITVFRASEAADAMFFLASAGLKTDQVIDALSGTLQLAAATHSDLAFTTERVVANMAAFGLQAREADRVANVFAATIGNSQATMERLATALSFVGPVANSVNLSIEETSAILGRLFTSGIQATTAGTALRMAIAQLLKPSEDAKEIMAKLGLTVLDSAGNLRNFIDIIEELESSGLSAADAMSLFGVRAGPAMLALVNQGTDALRGLITTVTGTNKAAEMAALQIGTFQGQMRLLRSATQELQIEIGTQLLPMLTDLVQRATKVALKIGEWTKAHKTLTKVIGESTIVLTGFIIAMTSVLVGIAGFTKVSEGVIFLIAKIRRGFFLLGNTMVLLKIRLAALAFGWGSIGIIIGAVTGVLAAVAGAWIFVKRAIVSTTQALVDNTTGIKRNESNLIGIKAALEDHEQALKQVKEAQDKGALAVSLFGTALNKGKGSLTDYDKTIRPVNTQVEILERKIKTLREQLRIASGDIFNTGERLITVKSIIGGLSFEIDKLIAAADKLATSFKRVFETDREFVEERVQELSAAKQRTEAWAKALGGLNEKIKEFRAALPLDAGQRRVLFFPETIDELIERIRLQERLQRIIGEAPVLEMAREIPTPIPLPPGFGPSEEALKNFETAFAQAQGRMKDIALARLAEQALAFRNEGQNEVDVNEFVRLRTAQIDEEFRNQTLEKSQALIMTLQQSRIDAELEAAEAIDKIRKTSFQMEQNRIKDIGRGYASFIRTAINIGRQFFSDQEAGWLRGLAALVRFITRAVAGFLKRRALEKLQQAEEANTAAAAALQLAARLEGLAAMAGAMSLVAKAFGLLFKDPAAIAAAELFKAAAISFQVEAGVAAASAVKFKGTAAVLQGEAAALMTASVAVQVSGEAVAGGIDAAADAARRAARAEKDQARDTEQRLQTELNLRQKILEMEGRTAEARRLGLEAEADRLRGLGIDPNLVNRFEQLSLRQTGQGGNVAVDTSFSPIPAVAGVGSGGTVVHQTNTFIGITDLSNQDQLRELAIAMRPFNEEIEDLETQA